MDTNNNNILNELNQIDKLKKEKIGLCGFKNMGNTCYMNSILQLLLHSRTLTNFLLCETNPFTIFADAEANGGRLTFVDLIVSDKINAPFIKFLKICSLDRIADIIRIKYKLDSNTEIKINLSDLTNYIENTLTVKLADLVNTIIYQGSSCITPTGIKKAIDRKIPSMRGFAQQDSHELLIGIIDILIEETGIDSEPVINNVPNSIKEYMSIVDKIRNKISKIEDKEDRKQHLIELNKYKEDNKETIYKFMGLRDMIKVFGNKRKNSLDTSTTGYNPMIFNLLTFDVSTFTCVECANSVYKYEFNTILSLNVKPTLEECFKDYVQPEQIERKCEICSNKKTIKQKQIWRPGMLLYIQLCRFNNLPNGRVWKNNQEVEIPNTIDLSEYCDNSMKTDNSLSYKYRLKGISNHMGSLGGGHYTADSVSLVDNLTWYHFDDSQVGRHRSESIDTSNAYILMYEMEPNK
jgi:ubiquitin carboxyl-terminal hydrolase 2/21